MSRLPTVGGDSNAWGTVLNDYLTNKGPSYGTTLPGSPQDEMEAVLVDSTTNPTYQWRFRYNAGASDTYKWEFIGGTPLLDLYDTQGRTGNTVFGDLTEGAALPAVTCPRAGIYDIGIGALFIPDSGAVGIMSFKIGATSAVDVDGVQVHGSAVQAFASRTSVRKTLTSAGTTLTAQYRTTAAGSDFARRYIHVLPHRVA